jgi:glyoxalase/bleomycin resistance protein/dioxygenase superfamily protein
MAVLAGSNVASRIPAQDLRRARSFYAGKLGLEPVEERPGGLRYRCGRGEFALFESAGAAAGDHTQMAWEVDDLEKAIAEPGERGVSFEEYPVPGLKTVNGIAEVEGNYPSTSNPLSSVRGRSWSDSSCGLSPPVIFAATGVVLFAPAFPHTSPAAQGGDTSTMKNGQASSGGWALRPCRWWCAMQPIRQCASKYSQRVTSSPFRLAPPRNTEQPFQRRSEQQRRQSGNYA